MLIEQHLVQAAILDANLTDRDVTPVTELLIEGGVPQSNGWHVDGNLPLTRATIVMAVETIAGRRRRWVKAGRKKPRTSGARRFMRRETRATNLS
jgi:hypothetical protein